MTLLPLQPTPAESNVRMNTCTNTPTNTHKNTQDQRALKRQAQEIKPQAGVYAVRHRSSARVLLGASVNVQAVLNRHRFELQLKSHRCMPLQADWSTQGPSAFEFEIVDTVRESDDPAFDRLAELQSLYMLWQEEFDRLGSARYARDAVMPSRGRT